MVAVNLDADEWYPVYSVTEDPSDYAEAVEVDSDTRARWVHVAAEFEAVQQEMIDALKVVPQQRR